MTGTARAGAWTMGREGTNDNVPDPATALVRLLRRAEREAGHPDAYGYPLEDPEHPWHGDVKAGRDALDALRRERGMPPDPAPFAREGARMPGEVRRGAAALAFAVVIAALVLSAAALFGTG